MNLAKNRLQSFPSVYFVSLRESVGRQQSIFKQFSQYDISPTPMIGERFKNSNDDMRGMFVAEICDGVYSNYQITGATLSCLVSHLKAIKQWLSESKDEYAFFCEDDLSLETVPYWGFEWSDFMWHLPSDWEAVQLLVLRHEFGRVEFRERVWDDWAHTAYLMRRSYAERLLETYVRPDHYFLEISGTNILPIGENVLFTRIGKVYSCPLFVEQVELESTFSQDKAVEAPQKPMHIESAALVRHWWSSTERTIFDLFAE